MTSPKARAELERLIALGLERYRRGEVDGALSAWEAALQAVPGDARALGYVDYVRQHYDHLSGDAPSPIAEMLVPFELGATRDSDDYEVSITRAKSEPDPGSWRGGRLPAPAVDDGWPIGSEPKPSTGAPDDDYDSITLGNAGRSNPMMPVPAPPPDDSGEATLDRYHRSSAQDRPTVDLAFDFGGRDQTGEPTLERSSLPAARRTAPMGAAPMVTPARVATPSTLRTGATRPPAPARPPSRPSAPPPPDGDLDLDLGLGLSLDLDLPGSPLELGIETVVPGLEPAGAAPPAAVDDRAVHVEELRLPPPTSTKIQTIDNTDDQAPPLPSLSTLGGPSARLLAEVDRDRAPKETPDEVARRRIPRLIDAARTAAARGDSELVIVAIDLALGESPDSALAQKLVHKNRDVLLDCYYKFFGSLERRPVVTGNLSELSASTLGGRSSVDPRAAFLLSRIDGMLTFDELLDVAGMGRLEACRHLAHLIGRGLVRSS